MRLASAVRMVRIARVRGNIAGKLDWQMKGSFTCFPMIQGIAGKNMCGKI